MKIFYIKSVVSVISLIFFIGTKAQSLRVVYRAQQDISKIRSQLKDPAIQQLVLKKISQPVYFELLHRNGVSLFRAIDGEDHDDQVQTIGLSENQVYKNFRTGLLLQRQAFLQRTFLIRDTLKSMNWELTDQTKKIGNYLCRKAFLKDKPGVEAWFAESIPVQDGPMQFSGLPGLILELTIPGGYHFRAEEIVLNAPLGPIPVPTGERELTRQEYKEIVRKKLRMMPGQNNNEQGVQIRVIRAQ